MAQDRTLGRHAVDGSEPTVENTFTSNDSYEFRAVSKQIRFVTTGLGSGDALKVSLFRAT